MDNDSLGTSFIWNQFLAGDKKAFAHFYNLHIEALYRYGTKLCPDEDLVKDAVQEIFLDLFVNRHRNKTNPENLRYYLILALKRNIIKKLKRDRKLRSEAECAFEPEYSIEHTIIADEEEQEVNHRVSQLLKSLPAKQKEALYLRFNESMDYPDIATVLNISVESARKQVYRALNSIRKKISKIGFLLFLTGIRCVNS